MTIKEMYEKAYKLMNEPIIDGNCGELCDFHCCRDKDENGNLLGVYLIPLEYEAFLKDKITSENKIELVDSKKARLYDLPQSIDRMYYFHCKGAFDCPREYRPIHCRTYPLEPHIENGELMLVVEKDQLHACPLLSTDKQWRPEYISGVYQGWLLLIEDPTVYDYVKYQSDNRIRYNNIRKIYDVQKNQMLCGK